MSQAFNWGQCGDHILGDFKQTRLWNRVAVIMVDDPKMRFNNLLETSYSVYRCFMTLLKKLVSTYSNIISHQEHWRPSWIFGPKMTYFTKTAVVSFRIQIEFLKSHRLHLRRWAISILIHYIDNYTGICFIRLYILTMC